MASTTDLFVSSIMTEQICLHPQDLHQSYRKVIEGKIKDSKEGKCSKFGFIRPGSIKILKVAPGITRMVSLNGDVVYDVQYKADVCNPMVGMIVKGKVSNLNKFGLLLTCFTDAMDEKDNVINTIPVIEIIVTRQSVGISHQVDLNRLTIGNEVKIEILGKKYELNDTKISAIGRIVMDDIVPKVSNTMPNGDQVDVLVADEDNIDDDDDDDEEDEEDGSEKDDEDGDDVGEREVGDDGDVSVGGGVDLDEFDLMDGSDLELDGGDDGSIASEESVLFE